MFKHEHVEACKPDCRCISSTYHQDGLTSPGNKNMMIEKATQLFKNDHSIKTASVIRQLDENSGDVMAAPFVRSLAILGKKAAHGNLSTPESMSQLLRTIQNDEEFVYKLLYCGDLVSAISFHDKTLYADKQMDLSVLVSDVTYH